jgi:(p)ppGpp synthase/HD superfamily hydrolase
MTFPELTERFDRAFAYARHLHRKQPRKGTEVPYIAHLLGVTALVLEDGGDEDQAIAALLHDAVEDQGGQQTLEEIRERFGDHIADIVKACSDSIETPKPPWRERKERYLEHLRHAGSDVQRVSRADKLNNARAILRNLKESGDEVWERFTPDKDGVLWYYRTLVEVLQAGEPSPLVDELAQVVAQIEQLASEGGMT